MGQIGPPRLTSDGAYNLTNSASTYTGVLAATSTVAGPYRTSVMQLLTATTNANVGSTINFSPVMVGTPRVFLQPTSTAVAMTVINANSSVAIVRSDTASTIYVLAIAFP